MGKTGREIKVTSNGLCDEETINEFNRRIAEIIAMKFQKNIVKEIITQYENKNKKN